MKNTDIFYQAMLARDYRFDGKFFVGVKTTGIYCRPICPAKPKRQNVAFYLSALAAEKAGYRPCLRCRPESAPLSAVWYGKSALVQQALKVIAQNAHFTENQGAFAAQFGVSSRHLRRLFEEEIGQTPKQIFDNNRLNFAKKLITETELPITTVALTAGFASVRRFNDAFKKRFQKAPVLFRKKFEINKTEEGVKLSLSFRPPFAWDAILNFYRMHQVMGVDSVQGTYYERVFKLDNIVGVIIVTPALEQFKINLQVHVDNPIVLFQIAQRIRQMFDLNSDPLLIANSFQAAHPFLKKLWQKYPGLRIPQGWDPFETAVCTILGQLVSMNHAKNLIAQLVKAYGERVIHPLTKAEAFIFPTPTILANASLAEVKTTQARKQTIRELARRVVSKQLDFYLPADPLALRKQLLEIPGIGPWSAEYISLRALGNTDAFPATDLILKRALAQHTDLEVDKLRPWRAYLAIYLWKEYAEKLSRQAGGK